MTATITQLATGPARRIASEIRIAHARGWASTDAATQLYLALAAVSDDVVSAECLEAAWYITPGSVDRRVLDDGRCFYTARR